MDNPILGRLKWDSLAWIGEVRLPTLAGCYRRWIANIECPDERSEKEKQGLFKLNVLSPAETEPSPEQIAAFIYLRDNEKTITDALMTGILKHFRELWFEDWQSEFKDKRLVERINQLNGIRETIAFHTLFVHADALDGYSYLGFEFACDWHAHLSEHDLGVSMHRERVVEVGQAEQAFDPPEEAIAGHRVALLRELEQRGMIKPSDHPKRT
jgi:hypothetical protein